MRKNTDFLIDAHCHLDEIRGYTLSKQLLPVATGHSHGSNRRTFEIAQELHLPFVLGISPQAAQKEGIAY